MDTASLEIDRQTPVDLVEEFLTAHKFLFERSNENELAAFVQGRAGKYQATFIWLPDHLALHLTCTFDFPAPANRAKQLHRLTEILNERMWVGRFDYWQKADMVAYRYAHLCPRKETFTNEQIDEILTNGLTMCEDYYMAFELVAKRLKVAEEALLMNITKTDGNA